MSELFSITDSYTVVDLETTGFVAGRHEISHKNDFGKYENADKLERMRHMG